MRWRHWIDLDLMLAEEPAAGLSYVNAGIALLVGFMFPFSKGVTVLILACISAYIGRLIRNRVTPYRVNGS